MIGESWCGQGTNITFCWFLPTGLTWHGSSVVKTPVKWAYKMCLRIWVWFASFFRTTSKGVVLQKLTSFCLILLLEILCQENPGNEKNILWDSRLRLTLNHIVSICKHAPDALSHCNSGKCLLFQSIAIHCSTLAPWPCLMKKQSPSRSLASGLH